MLQRTQFVDVSGLASFASDDQHDRNAAASRLDSAILDVLERQGRLNPDRARMRFGRVLQVIGVVLVVVGFASFVFSGFQMTQTSFDESSFSGFPWAVIVSFVIFFCGGLLGAIGSAMVRAGRAKGL